MVSKDTMVVIEVVKAKHATNGVTDKLNNAEYVQADASSLAKPGMISLVKNLYQGKIDDNGRRPWVEAYPDDLDDPAENAETARYALLIRNEKCYDGRRKVQIESIIIQSPLLRDALGSVLDYYPGITTGLERATFSPPFEPFVHRWNKLRVAVEKECNPETKAHVKLLYDVLEEELRSEIKARDDLLAHGVITFDYVWMLFEPGTIVYSTKSGEPCAVRLNFGQYGSNQCGRFYQLSCQTVDWDGESFGYGSTQLSIPEFLGTKPITDLTALPLAFHPNKDQVTFALIERGKTFERLAGYHYKAYQGVAVGDGPWGPVKYNVNSRIIVDTYAWNRFQPNKTVSVSRFRQRNKSSRQKIYCDDDEDCNECGSDYSGENDDDASENLEVISKAKNPHLQPLTQDQLLLCTAILKGYSLKDKKWLTFFIGSVKEIQWSDNAFSSLVLPEDQKDLILALTESQRANRDTFDDIIQGKGMGMIMLLSGPPGVGKTLTAESVAENMRTPLYMMAASDLGSDSSDVEENLSNILEMVDKWNAVLLLDEADVFLEERSAHDLERNKLVSIFLRILEYYSGILFLTTNRSSNIDPAFQSRIHISMTYQELTRSARCHVWSNFIASLAQKTQMDFSPVDLDNLSKYKMNGREIKNVLKTAQLLASSKGRVLGYSHVKSVLGIEKRFVEEQ